MKFDQFNDFLNECTIVSRGIGDKFVLFKNRDRGYYPTTKIIQKIIDGVEVVYVVDTDSGFKEGINEYGIAIINAKLSFNKHHKREPKDHFKIRSYSEDKMKNKKSDKESIVLEILSSCKTVDSAVTLLEKKKLMGITIISDGKKCATIENTETYGISISYNENTVDLLNSKPVTIVRTNHGVEILDAGYVEKPNSAERYSTEIRKIETERYLDTKIGCPTELFDLMSQQPYEKESDMNVFRTTSVDFTVSQMLIDPINLELIFVYCGDTKFLGIENEVEEPKIYVSVFQKTDPSIPFEELTEIIQPDSI